MSSAKPTTATLLAQLAQEKGIVFDPLASAISRGSLKRLQPARIGIWDQYGGAITSGWARFILEQFEFPYQLVYAPALDAGNLISRFDVLIFPDGANFVRPGARGAPRLNPSDVPAEYRDRVGSMTAAKTVPRILEFLNAGGTVLAIGSATDLALQLGLPITNALADSSGRPLPRNRYYVPGSILRLRVDTTAALAHGVRAATDFYFDNALCFHIASWR